MAYQTDPAGWMNNQTPGGASFQQEANALVTQEQVNVQGAGVQAWATVVSGLPAGAAASLGLAAKDIAMIIADAAGGYIVASSALVVDALSTLGIATTTGATLGPYGAAVGAAVGLVVAIATMPQASGSGPVPETTADKLATAYFTGTGAPSLAGWYWMADALGRKDASEPVVHPELDCTPPIQGFWGCDDLSAAKASVSGVYLAQMNPPPWPLPTPPDMLAHADAMAYNALARMPPPDLMRTLSAANDGMAQSRGWPNIGLNFAPNSIGSFDAVYAASAMTGAYPATMVALTKSLEASCNFGSIDPRVAPLQAIEAYYGTAQFQGLGPPQPNWGNLHLHNVGIQQQGSTGSPSVVTPARVAVALPVVAVAGSLIYDFVRKQAMGTAMKKAWQGAKRAVRGRR